MEDALVKSENQEIQVFENIGETEEKIIISRDEIDKNIQKWVNNFIGEDFTFRDYQKETIINILDDILNQNENSKVHIVEAPTGSGKSLINIISAGVLAEYYNLQSYILCSDLFLWDQYYQFIRKNKKLNNFGMLKGQTNNYQCLRNKQDIRNAECRMCKMSWNTLMHSKSAASKGFRCASMCQYVAARKKAIESDVCLMTYHLLHYILNVSKQGAFAQRQAPYGWFGTREVIFCDECHNIPNIISDNFGLVFSELDFEHIYQLYEYINKNLTIFDEDNTPTKIFLRQYPLLDHVKKFLNNIKDSFNNENNSNETDWELLWDYKTFMGLLSDICEEIEIELAAKKSNNKSFTQDDIQLYKQTSFVHNLCCHLTDFMEAIEETGTEYLIKEISKTNKDTLSISFKCAKEDYIISKYLLSLANNLVLLSATVGDHEAYDDNIGIKYLGMESSIMERVPSTFDFTESPIYCFDRYKMSYKEKDESLQKLKPFIYNIINKNAGKKGMIQTGSYELTRKLLEDIPDNIKERLIIYNNSKEKEQAIMRHKLSSKTDSIVMGPTLNEGIDLPDDDCRFIIIIKVPYPSLADKLTKAKIKLFPLWYDAITANNIIQGIGRGVRNENDYCKTYILDACFHYLYNKTKDQFSPELQNRIHFFK